jgi:hydrogenase/urease accessory protein HupE
VLVLLALWPAALWAHPVPFSFVDLRLDRTPLEAIVVVHIFDVANDLGIQPMERLLDPAVAAERSAAIAALLAPRLTLSADGRPLVGVWSAAEVLADRQSLRFRVTYPGAARVPGAIAFHADAFPYDPEHRTFFNIYEGGALVAQEILDRGRTEVTYYSGTRQGVWAVMARFIPSGVHHILIGPDHVLFLVGLLLTGGTIRRLALIVTAFTVAHSVTLTLAALDIVTPPAWVIEPAIALSIVYVGIDNLLRGDGKDMRAWIAFAFGFIHGFGFAYVLRDMDLPARALGWSLFSFNLGVEIGQLAVVAVIATALYAVCTRWTMARRPLMVAGSIAVVAAGGYWFVERTFLPGGM